MNFLTCNIKCPTLWNILEEARKDTGNFIGKNYFKIMKTPEISFSTNNTRDLIEEKKILRGKGFPEKETRSLVEKYYDEKAYEAVLKEKDNVYLIMPSTSGENTIPYAFAELLKKKYKGEILASGSYSAAMSVNEAKNKPGYIKKLSDPSSFIVKRKVLEKYRNKNLVLVDDILTSGESAEAMTEALWANGKYFFILAVLGAAYGGKAANVKTYKKLAKSIALKLDLNEKEVYDSAIEAHPAAFDNLLEKAAFEAERSKPKAEKVYELIRNKAENLRKIMDRRKETP